MQKVAEDKLSLPTSKLDYLEYRVKEYIYWFMKKDYSVSANIQILGAMITLAKGGRVRSEIIEHYKTALMKHDRDPDRGYLD